MHHPGMPSLITSFYNQCQESKDSAPHQVGNVATFHNASNGSNIPQSNNNSIKLSEITENTEEIKQQQIAKYN